MKDSKNYEYVITVWMNSVIKFLMKPVSDYVEKPSSLSILIEREINILNYKTLENIFTYRNII